MNKKDLKLHNFSWGLYPRRLHLYLSEKNLKIPTVEYMPQNEVEWPHPKVLEMNPYGTLPLLEIGEKAVITESLAIIQYLEKVFPENSMIGSNDIEYAKILKLATLADGANSIIAIWNHNVSPIFHGKEEQFKDAGYSGAYYFMKKLDILETAINSDHEFIFGNKPSIADCVTFPFIQFLEEFYDVKMPERFQKINSWYNHFKNRESVTKQKYIEKYPPGLLEISRGLEMQSGFSLEEVCTKIGSKMLN